MTHAIIAFLAIFPLIGVVGSIGYIIGYQHAIMKYGFLKSQTKEGTSDRIIG